MFKLDKLKAKKKKNRMVAPQESTALHELVIVDTTAAPALYIVGQ